MTEIGRIRAPHDTNGQRRGVRLPIRARGARPISRLTVSFERRLQPRPFRLRIQRPPVLAIRRRFAVEAIDREVCRHNKPFQVTTQARSRQWGCHRRPRQQQVPRRQQVPDLLVRLDPRRRHAGVAQHPKPERALTGRRVVVERDRRPLVGQLVECPVLHRLADLPLDDAFPRRTERDLALPVAPLRYHAQIVAAA